MQHIIIIENSDVSTIIQQLLFKAGFFWGGGRTKDSVRCTDKPILVVTENGLGWAGSGWKTSAPSRIYKGMAFTFKDIDNIVKDLRPAKKMKLEDVIKIAEQHINQKIEIVKPEQPKPNHGVRAYGAFNGGLFGKENRRFGAMAYCFAVYPDGKVKLVYENNDARELSQMQADIVRANIKLGNYKEIK